MLHLAPLRTTAFIAPSDSAVETQAASGQSAAPQELQQGPRPSRVRGPLPGPNGGVAIASTRPRRRSARRGSVCFRGKKRTRYAQLEPICS
jgi:hypothetical protein